MNWKQIVYTSAATLIVTVLSGVFVNWYTKNSIETKTKTENLIYEIPNSSVFQTDSFKISLYTIKVSNTGNEVSEDVKLRATFINEAKIIDANGKLERTKESFQSANKSKNWVELIIPKLYSGDNFNLNIALNGIVSAPEIIVQSNKSIGKLKSANKYSEESKLSQYYLIVILLAIVLMLPVIFILNKNFKPKRKTYEVSLNNTAFLFLHNNDLKFAKQLLLNQIEKNGASSLELANLALIEYFNNEDSQRYENLFKMAEILSSSTRSQLIIHFNKLIIFASQKNYVSFKDFFAACVAIEKYEFKKYIDLSLLISDLENQDLKLQELLKELKNSHFG